MRTRLGASLGARARRAPARSAARGRSPAPRGRCGHRANSRAGRRSSPPHAANTSAVETDTRGFTSSTGRPDSPERSTGVRLVARAFAAHRQAQQAGRNVAAELGRDRLRMRRIDAATRTSAGASAAAASAEPPPMPEATGSRLSSVMRRALARLPAASASAARGLQDQIVLVQSASSAANGPSTASESSSRRLRAQPVAVGAEGEDRLDVVPPVGQLAADVQREVELGRRDLAQRRSRRGVGWGQAGRRAWL